MPYDLICGSVKKEDINKLVKKVDESESNGFTAVDISSIGLDHLFICVLMHKKSSWQR